MDWSQLNWRAQIGDPHFMGWATVLAYAYCAWGSFRLYRNAARYFSNTQGIQFNRQRSFWGLMTIAMVLLAINKQLDLQTLLTEVGRLTSKEYDWYHNRREVQKAFIVSIAAGSLFIAMAVAYYYRQILAINKLALAGAAFVIAFVVIRAASFHRVDQLIGVDIAGLKINWILEWLGLTLIAANAHQIKKSNEKLKPPTT
ncbi:MAG TPA: hypothetical protein VIC26_14090 [Marinagarivorans sp.]